MHDTQWILSISWIKHGTACLQSKHLWGRGWRITSSRPAFALQDAWSQPVPMKKQHTNKILIVSHAEHKTKMYFIFIASLEAIVVSAYLISCFPISCSALSDSGQCSLPEICVLPEPLSSSDFWFKLVSIHDC